MSQHFDLVCEHGYKHGTCRCPAKDKAVRKMKCNEPLHATNPLNIDESLSATAKLVELYGFINEFAKATGLGVMDMERHSHEEFVLLAHNAAVAAKSQYDQAQRALWPERGRGC